METNEQPTGEIDRLVEALTPERIGEIDFDRVRAALGEYRRLTLQLADVAAALEQMREEYVVLRAEYVGRIAGMVKAAAAVTRAYERGPRERVYREALRYIESLETMSAAELIEQYRISAAKFREAFPGSFGPYGKSRRG